VKKKVTAEDLAASAWAAALVVAKPPDLVPAGFFTLQQIAAKLGKASSTVGGQLTRAVREGRATRKMFRVPVPSGGTRPVPHYKLK
jgi:hypothetical protein